MFPIIEVAGSPRERGRIHGTLARTRIDRSVATYGRLFAFCGIDWAGAQKLGAGYRDLIGDFDAELLEEIEGIAAGSGRHLHEILALNARTEILPTSYPAPHPDRQAMVACNAAGGIPDWGECTSIAIKPSQSTTGTTLLAQNWDWLGAQRQALVLLRFTGADGQACLTLTEAGMLAKIGLNSHGFGVCLNILRSPDDGLKPGVPVHVLLRALLKRTSVADAVAFASKLTFGASSNVQCADASGETAALEFSPRGLAVIRGGQSPDGRALCHTNHFLNEEAARHAATVAPSYSTHPRFERISNLTGAHLGRYSPQDLERMLRDDSDGLQSICRPPNPAAEPEVRMETVASVIMDLGARVMNVAPDLPSRVAYESIGLATEPVVV